MNIKGTKIPLKTYFDDSFIAKFNFPLPEFILSCNHAILFTDIIGSSQIYHDKGDQFGLIMASQKYEIAASLNNEDLYRDHIKIIKSMGDALFIVCENVLIAYRFTLDLINKIKKCSSQSELPLRIRATLHYGNFLIYTPEFQDSVDCFGETINNAARLEGENKRLISTKHPADDWSEYPLLVSGDFYTELIKTHKIDDEYSEPNIVKIREYQEKEMLAYLVNTSKVKLN